MHIAIDTTPLETQDAQRGIGTYTKNLIEALQKYERNYSYTLITRGHKVPDNVDLVHYPYFDPFFLTFPIFKVKPSIVTVHDLTPLVFPDKFPSGMRGALKWQIQKLSLGGAKRIITDSESSKSDISKLAGFDSRKIDVVYLAPAPIFAGSHAKSVKPPKPYFLYVGDVNWNKNVYGLLRAFAAVPGRELVLVGAAFTDGSLAETKELNRLISALGIEKRVKKTGRVSDRDLAGLYAGATALVQPSFYEGFGLPVLEAMCCGCPVVASETSSLSEIAGPAIRVEAGDVTSIGAGMTRVIALTQAERNKTVRDGIIWASKFTWQKTAHETVQSYERALR